MYENSKRQITCPVCGSPAPMIGRIHYTCNKCTWDSLYDTIDISYKDELTSPLSNLFPHKFVFYTCDEDKTTCLSMESFIQSLRVKDPLLQKYVCENYTGLAAYKLRRTLGDWRDDGIVYWQGKPIIREFEEYDKLITTAYDRLFESNPIFREVVLKKFKNFHIIHSIGDDSRSQSLLTEDEYRYQLNRLMKKV